MQFLDAVDISGVKETSEGYLVADVFAVRTGIQQYLGQEVGRPSMRIVNVYRPEEEVFSADTLRSFSHVPVTNDHPDEAVTKDNWKDLAVGEASTEVLRDGQKMRIPVIVKDAAAIADVRGGKRELSAGYSCDLDFVDGVAPDGTPYQAVQRNIRANHIAIVKRGRAGPEFRIGDNAVSWGVAPIVNDRESPAMPKILVDGITIETTDQGVEVINKLQKQLSDSTANIAKLTSDHAAEITAKDTKIGELTAQLADAKSKVPSGADLDKLVADRAALIDSAKRVHKDLKVEGLSDAEIRRAAVAQRYGEEMTKDMSDDAIAGMFKAALADAGKGADPVRSALANPSNTNDANRIPEDHGQGEYEKRLTDSWKTAGAK